MKDTWNTDELAQAKWQAAKAWDEYQALMRGRSSKEARDIARGIYMNAERRFRELRSKALANPPTDVPDTGT